MSTTIVFASSHKSHLDKFLFQQHSAIMCTPTSPSNSQNKKRKATADGDFASSMDDRILELESELWEKEKEIEEKDTMITKLKMIIEELKAKQVWDTLLLCENDQNSPSYRSSSLTTVAGSRR
jgi:uncharacterized coiled-coil protein SlyX